MRIEEHFSVPFPPERVWAFLCDRVAVARCMPGAELTAVTAEGHLEGRFAVKLGPITAAFAGAGDLRLDEASRKGEITGSGNDGKTGSRAKATAVFALFEEEGGTRVEIALDYTLAGLLAQFGRAGIVRDLAARLTAQFAGNLRTALSAEPGPAAAGPLDAAKLVSGVIRNRLRRRERD
jgi:uncharacterized protein